MNIVVIMDFVHVLRFSQTFIGSLFNKLKSKAHSGNSAPILLQMMYALAGSRETWILKAL